MIVQRKKKMQDSSGSTTSTERQTRPQEKMDVVTAGSETNKEKRCGVCARV